MKRQNLRFASLFIPICVVESYKILAVMPMPAESHHGIMRGVLKTLQKAGHHVTSYTPFPVGEIMENYTEIRLKNTWESAEERARMILEAKATSYIDRFNVNYKFDQFMYETFLTNEIQALLKSREKFDLILTEQLFGEESYAVLGHIFKAPMIAIQSYMGNEILNSLAGNSLSMAYLPFICSQFSNEMSFSERVMNTFAVVRQLYYYYYDYLPKVEARTRKHVPDMPPLLDLLRSTSLYFVNDHLTADYAQPRTPNVIPVGGIHIQPLGKLPQNLQTFLDEASEGFILFSLGTYTPDQLESKDYFDKYLDAFRKLKQRVIWKSRKTNIEGVPDNVIVQNWLPQREILAHPNCVLFVTHGGHNSQLEAIHYGVPVIAIPLFFDQTRNAMLYEAKGVGIRLNEEDVTAESLYKSIRTVIEDKRYKENMSRLSAVFRDRPLSAARAVVYWVEYVIRHAGAPHLRPVAAGMPWYQRTSLDVLAVAISIVIFTLCLLLYTMHMLCTHRKPEVRKNKKEN